MAWYRFSCLIRILADVAQSVRDLIALARRKGINAYLVEAGTFDTMLMRLWRQLSQKPAHLETKIFTTKGSAGCHSIAAARTRLSRGALKRAAYRRTADALRQSRDGEADHLHHLE